VFTARYGLCPYITQIRLVMNAAQTWYIMFEKHPVPRKDLRPRTVWGYLRMNFGVVFKLRRCEHACKIQRAHTGREHISGKSPSHQCVLHDLPISSSLKGSSLIFCDEYKLGISKYVGTLPTSATARSSWLVIRKFPVLTLRALLAALECDSDLF
jgi:hypothetical protein